MKSSLSISHERAIERQVCTQVSIPERYECLLVSLLFLAFGTYICLAFLMLPFDVGILFLFLVFCFFGRLLWVSAALFLIPFLERMYVRGVLRQKVEEDSSRRFEILTEFCDSQISEIEQKLLPPGSE